MIRIDAIWLATEPMDMRAGKGIPIEYIIAIDDELWRKARESVDDEMTDSEIIALALTTFVRLKAVKPLMALDGDTPEV